LGAQAEEPIGDFAVFGLDAGLVGLVRSVWRVSALKIDLPRFSTDPFAPAHKGHMSHFLRKQGRLTDRENFTN